MRKAGSMVQQINGVNEGKWGKRVIVKARRCRVGGCTGASRGWGIHNGGKVIYVKVKIEGYTLVLNEQAYQRVYTYYIITMKGGIQIRI